MLLHWFEQSAACAPPGDEWLSDSERATLAGLGVPKRRGDWRLGRWTAKLAIAVRLGLPPAAAALRRIELRPALSGAPRAFVDGSPARLALSLSHSGGVACCAIMDAEAALGCDIERIEARAAPFACDYFTDRERLAIASWPAALQNAALTLYWSAKESVLKALETGLRVDPMAVSVNVAVASAREEGWVPLCAAISGSAFAGWWRAGDGFIRTVVAEPAPLSPANVEFRHRPPGLRVLAYGGFDSILTWRGVR